MLFVYGLLTGAFVTSLIEDLLGYNLVDFIKDKVLSLFGAVKKEL